MSAVRLTVEGGGLAVPVGVAIREAPVSETSAAVQRVDVALLLGSGRPVMDCHLRVRQPAPSPWPLLADVLAGPGGSGTAAEELAAGHPGAAVIAVYGDAGPCWLRLGAHGSGGVLLALAARQARRMPWSTWASLAHAWLVAGLPATALISAVVRDLGPEGQSDASCPAEGSAEAEGSSEEGSSEEGSAPDCASSGQPSRRRKRARISAAGSGRVAAA